MTDEIINLQCSFDVERLAFSFSDQGSVIGVNIFDVQQKIRVAQIRGRLAARWIKELRVICLDGRPALIGEIRHVDDETGERVRGQLKIQEHGRPIARLPGFDLRQP